MADCLRGFAVPLAVISTCGLSPVEIQLHVIAEPVPMQRSAQPSAQTCRHALSKRLFDPALLSHGSVESDIGPVMLPPPWPTCSACADCLDRWKSAACCALLAAVKMARLSALRTRSHDCDVLRVIRPRFSAQSEVRARERGRQLGYQFFHAVGVIAEPLAQFADCIGPRALSSARFHARACCSSPRGVKNAANGGSVMCHRHRANRTRGCPDARRAR